MFDEHDPRLLNWRSEEFHREAAYRRWCRSLRLDPEDQRSAVEYEKACLSMTNNEKAAEEWAEILGA